MNIMKKFKKELKANFEELTKGKEFLYCTNINKDILWETYINSFPEGSNEVYITNREYDCNCCKSFMRAIGNAIAIKDCKVKTVWDFETSVEEFKPVIKALDKYVKEQPIQDVYFALEKKVGTDKNVGADPNNDVKFGKTFEHMFFNVDSKFVRDGLTKGTEISTARAIKEVFKRGLDELTLDSLETILDLIMSNTLYRGEEWKEVIKKFIELKKHYETLAPEEIELYAWEKALKISPVIAKIRNTSMGTLLINVSEGMDLDSAVKKYESIVAPENYQRSKPIYSKKMQEQAMKVIMDLGIENSLGRRHSTLDDITINNILFSNKDASKRIQGSFFEELMHDMGKAVEINPKSFSKVEQINIEKFISDVLPTCTELEVLLEGKHSNNFVSLIAPQDIKSNPITKWDNNFTWSYTGNITDSTMKERVKNAGGKVDGVLRFSLQWNDLDTWHEDDLDAHCVEPTGNRIYFSNKARIHSSSGMLDIDVQSPIKGEPAVENIVWTNSDRMPEGKYLMTVHNYHNRGGKDGFRAEIEFNGEVHSFDYRNPIRTNEYVDVAEVHFDGENFTITEKLPSTSSSREIWNLSTNQFVPVSVVMYSPNYWNAQTGIGHKHYMFMLKDCISKETPNGFYNEFLKSELREHRKFFEALSNKLSVADTDDQLSGLGFSSTKRNELIVKCEGNMTRVMRILF